MDELTIYASASDGWIHESSTISFADVRTSPTGSLVLGGTNLTVWLDHSVTPAWGIARSYLFFDTSALPDDAVISAATLSIYPTYLKYVSPDWDLVIQSGMPTYPRDPMVPGGYDFYYAYYSGDGGSRTASTMATGIYNDITLTATGRGWINKTGTTKLCLRNNKDIDGTDISAGDSININFYSSEKGGAYRPKLTLTYYTPVVTTYVPTDFLRSDPTKVTARGLAEVPLDITTRGFKYGLTETDTWDESETGTFSEGAFSLQLTGLTGDTTYYIRAYMIGAWGTEYGEYLEFKTAYPYGSFNIEIKSEATTSASEIADVGGKRSLTIENHLIQTQTLADSISAAYLAEYKDQKMKLVVTKPTPAPYEIGDTITRDMDDTILPYYASTEALISYATVANAEYFYNMVAKRDMIIRKLNVNFSAGNYVSVIELED